MHLRELILDHSPNLLASQLNLVSITIMTSSTWFLEGFAFLGASENWRYFTPCIRSPRLTWIPELSGPVDC